tara:strand:- start:5014 stop:7260 length:2247 start_codon:yes stop_codon:yes gene_type:complete
MLRLTLWSAAGGGQYNVDLYENVPVNLTYQFSDVTQINKAKGSYSQTFRIPATKANKRFFETLEDATLQPTTRYSVKRKIIAELSYNTIPLMRGYIQIKKAIIQKKDFADFEIIFFGEVLTLAKALQEKDISDLDTSALNHDCTYTNVVNSWYGAGGLLSGNVVYGVMDKGRNWTEADDGVFYNSFVDQYNGIWAAELTPFIRVKWLLDKILSTGGFTYSSAFFDTANVAKMYLAAYNGSTLVRAEESSAETEVAAAGLASDFALTSSYQTIPIVDTVTGGYDYGSNFSNTTHKWTAPYDCLVTVSTRTNPVNNQTNLYDLRTYINSALAVTTAGGGGNTTYQRLCLAGNTVYFTAKRQGQQGVTLDALGAGRNEGTWIRIDAVSEQLMGQTVLMNGNLPKIKQIDFLMGLQKMFNLVFVPDTNKPNHLIIEPLQDYVATGTQKDWTNKIDYTKDVIVQPTTDLQRNVLDWTHSAGQDFVNVAVQNSTDRVYGRMRIRDTDNDFATGEQEIKTPFSPYLLTNIPSSDITIHRAIDKDGNGVKEPKPQIAYFNGASANIPWYLRDAAGTEQIQTSFPYFSNYDAVNPSVTNNDLNFGYEIAFFATDAHPLNTLYYKYWMSYVNELYSETSRLLTAYVKLTKADIQDFEFSDKIYIKNAYYRVLKISNYDATTGGSVQVHMIKVMSDIKDCVDVPSGQKTDGVIVFNGSNTDYGSQACCERYGYVWINRKLGTSQCYPRAIAPQPATSNG